MVCTARNSARSTCVLSAAKPAEASTAYGCFWLQRLAVSHAMSPNSTCCVTARHVTTQQARRVVRVVTWHDVTCCVVLCRACCAVSVPTRRTTKKQECSRVKTILCFIIYHFSSHMKLIRLLKKITAIATLYTLQTKLRIAFVALVATCCVSLAVQHARHSTYDFFL